MEKIVNVTYGYKVAIDMTGIVEMIIDQLPGENKDWEFDGERLIITQENEGGAEVYSQEATYMEPADYECTLIDNLDDFDAEKAVLDGIKSVNDKCISAEIDIDDQSDWDIEDIGPDSDQDYDDSAAWDD